MSAGKAVGLLLLTSLLAACGTSPPRTPNDLCGIFREKDDWYDAAKVTQKRWGVPIQVPFAIMYQESGFHQDALAPRKYLLWIIPWGRVSTAAGYAQAKDEVWNDYRKSTGRSGASRQDFDDAIDFVGWYMDKTYTVNGVYKYDAYGQYLNYHEGWGGYRQRTYAAKAWLPPVASKVQARSQLYAAQYARCKDDLGRGGGGVGFGGGCKGQPFQGLKVAQAVSTLWRAGLPCVGSRSDPGGRSAVNQALLGRWFWGRFATQRGASPLATVAVTTLLGGDQPDMAGFSKTLRRPVVKGKSCSHAA